MQTEVDGGSANGLSSRQLSALRFVAEQAMVPLDQLARALVVPQDETERLALSLERGGLCRGETFIPNDSRWVWLTRSGSEASSTGLPHRSRPPDPRLLGHWRAVNDVRLFLEAREPAGRWFSETMLFGGRRGGVQLPDAVFEVGGERHAIEVELSDKGRSRYERLWSLNSGLYDAVIYFCDPVLCRRLRRLRDEGDWPKVVIRDLPGFRNQVRAPRLDRMRDPRGRELRAMQLIAEQGIIREDQLARFLDLRPVVAADLVDSLVEGNFVTRKQFFDGEPAGVYLTDVGNRMADTPLTCLRPKIGGVKERYRFNDLRLHVSLDSPEAEWISRRMLTKIHGTKESAIPGAEVRLKGLRFAINYREFSTAAPAFVHRTTIQNARYDAVVFFCADLPTRRFIERLQRKNAWSKVVARDLPETPGVLIARRSSEQLVTGLFGY